MVTDLSQLLDLSMYRYQNYILLISTTDWVDLVLYYLFVTADRFTYDIGSKINDMSSSSSRSAIIYKFNCGFFVYVSCWLQDQINWHAHTSKGELWTCTRVKQIFGRWRAAVAPFPPPDLVGGETAGGGRRVAAAPSPPPDLARGEAAGGGWRVAAAGDGLRRRPPLWCMCKFVVEYVHFVMLMFILWLFVDDFWVGILILFVWWFWGLVSSARIRASSLPFFSLE